MTGFPSDLSAPSLQELTGCNSSFSPLALVLLEVSVCGLVVILFLCLFSLGDSSLPCDFSSPTDLKRVVSFVFQLLADCSDRMTTSSLLYAELELEVRFLFLFCLFLHLASISCLCNNIHPGFFSVWKPLSSANLSQFLFSFFHGERKMFTLTRV